MPTLRDIKRSIKSVKNTRQITKAMKMVSAAKLRKAQDDIAATRPYMEKMIELILSHAAKTASAAKLSKAQDDIAAPRPYTEKMIGLILSHAAKTAAVSHPLLSQKEEVKNIGVIFITSDRGLCGSFNAVLLRTVEGFMRELGPGKKVSLNLIGKRASEYFKRREVPVISARPFGGRPNYAVASDIAKDAIELYTKDELDAVYIIYSEFKSALTQRPVAERLLPIPAARPEEGEEAAEESAGWAETDIIYEPSVKALIESLLPRYVEVQVFRALLNSSASEHGARMTAMDSASKNAAELIGALTLKYNRLRQAAITKELMEIISGAESLKG